MQQAWRLTVQPRWSGTEFALADSLSQWPAQWLTGLGTPWNTVQADGQLTLVTQGLTLQWAAGRLLLGGRVQLDATQMSSRLSTLKPMGSYRISLLGGAGCSHHQQSTDGKGTNHAGRMPETGKFHTDSTHFDDGTGTVATPDDVQKIGQSLQALRRSAGKALKPEF